jgi:hypothetical protein
MNICIFIGHSFWADVFLNAATTLMRNVSGHAMDDTAYVSY